MSTSPDWHALDGADRRRVADDVWRLGHDGPHDAALIVGFPGVGKTHLAEALLGAAEDAGRPTALITAPPPETADVHGVMVAALADELRAHDPALAGRVAAEDTFNGALGFAIRGGAWVVVDDIQRQFPGGSRRLPEWVSRTLKRKGKLAKAAGCLVLVANRSPDVGPRAGQIRKLSLEPPAVEAAGAILDGALPRPDALPAARRVEVINRLGANPRALTLLAQLLDTYTVGDLLGPPKPDAPLERDPTLVRAIERQIVGKATADLPDEVRGWMRLLTALRVDAEVELIAAMAIPASPGGPPRKGAAPEIDWKAARQTLRNRYLLRIIGGQRDRLHPLAVELERPRLQADAAAWAEAHRRAGWWFARPLLAKRVEVHPPRLEEARHHFAQAGDEAALQRVLATAGAALGRRFGYGTPMPTDDAERDARIALLSAWLDRPGPVGAEYHLARLLAARGRPADLSAAVEHARRGTVGADFHTPWLLWVEVVAQVEGAQAGIAAAREAIGSVAPNKNLFSLYQAAGELLAGDGRVDAAVALLREGIGKIDPQHSLFSLYQAAGELLVGEGRVDEAVELLGQGIGKVDPQYSLHSLYQAASGYLARSGQVTAALSILEEGAGRVPAGRGSGARLAEAAVLIATAAGQRGELLRLLADGLKQSVAEGPGSLGQSLDAMLVGDWARATELAAAGRLAYPSYLPLACIEALGHLGTDDPQAARGALDRFPGGMRHAPSNPLTWLSAAIAVVAGDAATARERWAIYTDDPSATAPDRAALLAAWSAPFRLGELHPAFYHPILPRALTGLPHDLRRPPHGPPVPLGGGAAAVAIPAFTPEAAELPPPLVRALRNGRLMPLVGAGLSLGPDVVGGFPSWRALPARLLDAGDARWVWLSNDDRQSMQRLFLQDDPDTPGELRPRPMLLADMLRRLDQLKDRLGADYPAALDQIFRPPDAAPGATHQAVMALGAQVVLTTNYDPLLEAVEGPPTRTVYTWKQAQKALADIKSGRKVLFKVHGTAEDADSVVMTLDEYGAAHGDASYRAVMGHLLVDHCVLFVGYGMSDPYDLDLLLGQNVADFGGAVALHFALLPRLDDAQAELERADKLRREHRVVVLPYTVGPNHDHGAVLATLRALAEAAG